MSGEFIFKGERLSPARIEQLRGWEIALVPQSISHLNPLTRVQKQVYRSARLSGRCHCTAHESCDSAFARYHLGDAVKSMFPFQVSGGMARRILTATATAGKADLIIADEPTTGLDPEVTRQSLQHLQELAAQDKGILLIPHDLENAVRIADTLVVLYNGSTIEITPTSSLHSAESTMHPYTRALWRALQKNGFTSLPVTAADDTRKNCCCFASRCPVATDSCRTTLPALRPVENKMVRCTYVAG